VVDRTGSTLVIPAWNEPEAIGGVLDEVPPNLLDEVLVVVGSSTDPTGDVARARGARVLVQAAPGYGSACWTGAESALARGAHVIAFLDGDYADPPVALPRLLAPIQHGRADLVLGCRDLRRFPDALPSHARLGNALVRVLMRVLLRTDFRDLPSCKAIRAEALSRLNMRERTYGWTVEMLAKAARTHLRIEQIEIEYRPRRGGRSKVGGDPRASVLAAYKLLGCAVTYSTSRQWSAVGGQ
jgi:glycosyltransferase involved in cell wall biosynthesis